MARALKIAASIVCLIVILLAVAIIVLATAVNPNHFKSSLQQYVKHKTGRTLTLKGNLNWSFFPWIGLEAQNVTVGSTANFKNVALATIGSMKLKMHAWSLIRGNYNIKEISLDHANINLITNAKNQTNWSRWNKATHNKVLRPTTTRIKTTQQIQPTENPKQPTPKLSINTLSITNSSIHLINESTHTIWNLNKLNLSLKNFNTKKYFPLKLNFDSTQNDSKSKIHTDLEATANMNLQTGEISVPQIKIYNKIYRPNLAILPVDIQGDLYFDPSKQNFSFKKAILSVANMKLTGNIALTHLLTVPRISLDLKNQNTDLSLLLDMLLNKHLAGGTLSGYAKLNSYGSGLQKIISNLAGQGNLEIQNGTIYGVNLVQLLDRGAALIHNTPQPSKANNKNETRFSRITGDFKIKNGTLNNNNLNLIGDRLSGKGKGIINFNNQAINYNLNIQYLYPEQQGGEPFTLPITISGKLNAISIRPNYNAIAKHVIKDQIENFIKKETNRSKSHIGNIIKGLFK